MKLDIMNNVSVSVKDSDGNIKQTVETHNKATRNMVRGILNFLEGKFTYASVLPQDDTDARKYIPCYIGYGRGGFDSFNESGDPQLELGWNNRVNYNDTKLVDEFDCNRSRVRKQSNTFNTNSGKEEPSAGDMDSLIMYTEISPLHFGQDKVCVTELGLFPNDTKDKDDMLAQVKFAYSEKPDDLELDVVKGTVSGYDFTSPVDSSSSTVESLSYRSSYEVKTSYSVLPSVDISTGKVGFILSSPSSNTTWRFRRGGIYGSVNPDKNRTNACEFMDDYNGNLVCMKDVKYSIGGQVLIPKGTIVGHTSYEWEDAQHTFFDMSKIVDMSDPSYINRNFQCYAIVDVYNKDNVTTEEHDAVQIELPQSEYRERIKKNGFEAIINLTYSGSSLQINVHDDSNGNILCSENVTVSGSTVLHENDIVGTIDYNTFVITLREDVIGVWKQSGYTSKTWNLRIGGHGAYYFVSPGNVAKLQKPVLDEYTRYDIDSSTSFDYTIPIGLIPEGTFPGIDQGAYFSFKIDQNWNLVTDYPVQNNAGTIVYVPIGTVIGTFNPDTWELTFKPEYTSDITDMTGTIYLSGRIYINVYKYQTETAISSIDSTVTYELYDTQRIAGKSLLVEHYTSTYPIGETGNVSVDICEYSGCSLELVNGAVTGIIDFESNGNTVQISFEDDSNGNLVATQTVSGIVSDGEQIGTVSYTSMSFSFDTSKSFITYPETCSVDLTYRINVNETPMKNVCDALVINPNDTLSVKWVISVAAIGENNIFDNRFVYDENGKPVDNTYNGTNESLSNIIVVDDDNNN